MFYLQSAKSQQLLEGKPWEFQVTEPITDEIRFDKQTRQDWYQRPDLKHCFYTFFEGVNNRMRIGKENPVKQCWAVVADYDIHQEIDAIHAGIAKMDRKPNWLEISLGKNFRLIWLFEEPLPCVNTQFAVIAFKHLLKWLPTNKLAGLDEKAFIDPAKTYCNGGEWYDLKNPPIPAEETRGLFVEIGRTFSHRGPEAGPEIPLDVVAKELANKFPSFRWPCEFVLNSQGPTFWVSGSTSPMSAIVKEAGMLTFAAHAEKNFYSWRELLGADFCDTYELRRLGEAAHEIYYDGHSYWRRNLSGAFISETKDDIRVHLLVDRGVSPKIEQGVSPIDRTMQYVRNFGRVRNVGSIVYRPPGILTVRGEPHLNTFRGKIIHPANGNKTWADARFLNAWLPLLFANKDQFEWIMSWLSYAYKNALDQFPVPGQAVFMAGAVGRGKTLFANFVAGDLLGGFGDAAGYLLDKDPFNSDLFNFGVWTVNDETVSNDEGNRRMFSNLIKKTVANSFFRSNEKFLVASMVEWIGRLIVTLNFDVTSSRVLIDTESSMMDKVSFIRCADELPGFVFPTRKEITAYLETELPILGRLMVDWKIPSRFLGETRFGLEPMHDAVMKERAQQTSSTAAFYELVTDFLNQHFEVSKEDKLEVTTTKLLQMMIAADPAAAELVRKYSPDHAGRLLARLMSNNSLAMKEHTGLRGHSHLDHFSTTTRTHSQN